MKKYIAFILISLFVLPANARRRSLDEEKVINEIWARTDMPEFKNYKIEEQYKNEPVVILARYQEFIGNVKVAYMGGQMPCRGKEFYRNLIMINDNSAIRQFSTIEYVNNTATRKQVVGIRVIKNDGSVVEINPNDYIKISTDLNNKRKKNNITKIAVPNLQKGDVIDYFIYEEEEMYYNQFRHFYINDNAPIQSYRFHGAFDYGVMTDTWYWLPDNVKATEQRDESEKRTLLDFNLKNIDKKNREVMSSPFKNNPRFRFVFASLESGSKCKDIFPKHEYGLHRKTKEEGMLVNKVFNEYDFFNYMSYSTAGAINKELKKYFDQHPGLSDKQKADEIYNYLATCWIRHGHSFNSDNKAFFCTFRTLLRAFKIPVYYGIAIERNFGDRKDALVASDFDEIIKLKDGTFYETCSRSLPCVFDKSADWEGTEGLFFLMDEKTTKYKSCDDYKKLIKQKIPVTPAEKNKTTFIINVNIDPTDGHALDVTRTVALTGSKTRRARNQLGTFWQWDSIMRQHFGITTKFNEDPKIVKAITPGATEKWTRNFDYIERNQKEAFDEEAKDFFENHVKEVKSYKIDSYGLFENDKSFRYTSEAIVEDMVRTTDRSKVVNIGKLLDKMNLNTLKKDRQSDVELKSTFLDSYEINFKIPTGYEVKNLEAFNKNISNTCGSFVSKAKIDNNKLVVNVDWQINNIQFPASEWSSILDILNGFKSFNNTSVVLTQK